MLKPDRRAVLLFCILACGSGPAAAEKIELAAFEYPPIYQKGDDRGLSGDIATAALNAVNLDVELRFFPVARMVQSVSSGQSTCALGGAVLFAAPEVARQVRIGGVLQYVAQTFVFDRRHFPSGLPYTRLEQLRGYRIGALYSSGIMRLLENTGGLALSQNSSHEGLAKQLHAGRIDLWATVDLTGRFYMNKLFPDDAAYFDHTASFNRGDVSFVCSRLADPEGVYLEKFADGLARIKRNGTYMKIMAKYYGGIDRINRDSLTNDMR